MTTSGSNAGWIFKWLGAILCALVVYYVVVGFVGNLLNGA
jgi:hypothetical protein